MQASVDGEREGVNSRMRPARLFTDLHLIRAQRLILIPASICYKQTFK
jgi:hypothetical protein